MSVDQKTWDHDHPVPRTAGKRDQSTVTLHRPRPVYRPPLCPCQSHRMASISFPNSSHYGMSSINSNAEDEDNPYHSNFDTTHGIQMNPLSPHPPRTPRTSTAHSSGYDISASSPRHIPAALDVEPEEERVHDHPAKTRVRSEEVWREIVKSSDGRDKAFVCHVSVPPFSPF